ncbi:uncharacterized protein [Salminus brasiliensis]|uniref:uncharacterized protein n=1 Tax=Salminus brasiliensis TaxID=930266 RepID=UPI003B82D2B3
MSEKSLCVFFILAFLQTGSSNSSVHISQRYEGKQLNVTCILSGKENLTQVNWEMVQDSNRTNLGVFHPSYGHHVRPEHIGKVKIEGKQHPHACSSVSLEIMLFNNSGQICCTFMTFPSGNLKECAKISNNEEVTNTKTVKSEAQGAGHELGLLGQLGVLIIASILSLIFFTIPVYLCYRCCHRRKQVFNVQQANLTVPLASTETNTEEIHEAQHTVTGFDPAKLYAKIKEDLYYGRLWKSYQGRARIPTQGSPSAPRQIYYRLGERRLPQGEKESTPTGTDTMTSPPVDSNK